MMAALPDTLGGALLLSAIDFLLSCVVLHFFPLLNKLGEVKERKD